MPSSNNTWPDNDLAVHFSLHDFLSGYRSVYMSRRRSSLLTAENCRGGNTNAIIASEAFVALTDFQSAVTRWLNDAPGARDDAAVYLRTPPENCVWRGKYYAAKYDLQEGYTRLVTDDIVYDNPGDAVVAAIASVAESPGGAGRWQATCLCTDDYIASDYYNGVPAEFIGQSFNQSTATIKTLSVEDVGVCCSNCGRIGHNSRSCTGPEKAYDKVGIEIEGRWLDLNATKDRLMRDYEMSGYYDGSVHSAINTNAKAWEFQTKPGSLGSALKQLIAAYPDEADGSCGMHVHVSFSASDMILLCNLKFQAYFERRWREWAARKNLSEKSLFFKRLDGKNTYCKPMLIEPNPLRMDRYAQLNFSSWNEHRTVECRLLPMFNTQSLAVDAVQELIDIYETWLANPAQHGLDLPDQSFKCGIPATSQHVITKDVEIREDKHEFKFELELEELPAPAPGMVRMPMVHVGITPQGIERLHQTGVLKAA